MNTIKITDELKARIRDHEGCVDTVYLDSLGKATIGIGHLVQAHERKRFKEGVKIDQEEIEDLFLIDLLQSSSNKIRELTFFFKKSIRCIPIFFIL
jgi:GH24 family phage-related lysozyme (muramidase)